MGFVLSTVGAIVLQGGDDGGIRVRAVKRARGASCEECVRTEGLSITWPAHDKLLHLKPIHNSGEWTIGSVTETTAGVKERRGGCQDGLPKKKKKVLRGLDDGA